MLRKAFEHENIDSSNKANGLIPIFVRRPRLALILTGTPAQLKGLLDSYENDLANRILYYTFREAPHWKDIGDEYESIEDHFKLQIVLCCYEHSLLPLSSMTTPSIQPPKNPDIISRFDEDLPNVFATEEAIRIGVIYGFSLRKIACLLKALNNMIINKVSHDIYEKPK